MSRGLGACVLALLAIAAALPVVCAEDEFELPPIRYSASTPDNAVSRLQTRLDAGEGRLLFDPRLGWLKSVLAALDVPESSQTLVFSKTSLQQTRIRPQNPRALYFSDDVYVGYVRDGEVVEVSVADPDLGTVFYAIDQVPAERPRFERRTEDCLICHGGSQTHGVPGHIIRSVYPSASGQPIFSAGSHRVDHTTPHSDRWGGWYVTGRHGDQHHLGNVTFKERPSSAEEADRSGLNVTDLGNRFGATGYLSTQHQHRPRRRRHVPRGMFPLLRRAPSDRGSHRDDALRRRLCLPRPCRSPGAVAAAVRPADATLPLPLQFSHLFRQF